MGATLSVLTQSPTASFSLSILGVLLLWTLYRYLLPKPIPGLPHDTQSAKSILGDARSLLREADGEGKLDFQRWLLDQARKHSSPIFQVFLIPLKKPIVVLCDFRESQDILMRRKEFDRSDFSIEALTPMVPFHHINLKTGPAWKAHRRLLADLMTPAFLNDVAGPNIYFSALNLLELWQRKAEIASGRPFAANNDIYYSALDAVLEFSFGANLVHRALAPQIRHANSLDDRAVRELREKSKDGRPIEVGDAEVDDIISATLRASDIVEDLNIAAPRFHWWWMSKLPKEARQLRVRDAYVKEQVLMAVDRLHSSKDSHDDDGIQCAVDLMVNRERRFAEKDGREPIYWSKVMRDEILGFVIAGHDTTSTTLCWGVKLLADNPAVQRKLRSVLHEAHAAALAESRLPTIDEITSDPLPYVEAVAEEILRCGITVPSIERQCTQDTTILGYHIPKGTDIFMLTKGASFTEPSHQIDEWKRSDSSQAAGKDHGVKEWEPEGMDKFDPERWLERNAEGNTVFNVNAGPNMQFGLGIRGCFGRKLAYLELRILITVLIWSFEFLPCPDELSGYEAVDGLTHKPQQCYVTLKSLGMD